MSSGCSQPRVGLLTKLPWRVHSSPPSWPPSTRVFFPPLFISWEQTVTGPAESEPAAPPGADATVPAGPGSPGLPPAEEPRRLSRLAGFESFRLAILGKKEQRVVGLSSDSGESSPRGAAGPREEEDREPGRDWVPARDSTGEAGTPRPPTTSSREETDSFRRWLYLLFCRRSMPERGEKGRGRPGPHSSGVEAAGRVSRGPHGESERLQPPGNPPQAQASSEFRARPVPARHGWQGEPAPGRQAAGPGAARLRAVAADRSRSASARMCRSGQTESDPLLPPRWGGNGAAATPRGAAGAGTGAQRARPPAWRSSSPTAGSGTAALRSSPCAAPLPLGGNQKHEYLKPGDKAATERIQAQPSPAPSTVQERTRSFCGRQRYAAHVPAVGSRRWLPGLCRGERRPKLGGPRC